MIGRSYELLCPNVVVFFPMQGLQWMCPCKHHKKRWIKPLAGGFNSSNWIISPGVKIQKIFKKPPPSYGLRLGHHYWLGTLWPLNSKKNNLNSPWIRWTVFQPNICEPSRWLFHVFLSFPDWSCDRRPSSCARVAWRQLSAELPWQLTWQPRDFRRWNTRGNNCTPPRN